LVCYIRKYVIILWGEDIPVDVSPTKILGDVPPASPAGLTPVVVNLTGACVELADRVLAWYRH